MSKRDTVDSHAIGVFYRELVYNHGYKSFYDADTTVRSFYHESDPMMSFMLLTHHQGVKNK